jgi:hypothetical protein
MTIQELKSVFGKYGIKFKRNVPDDYFIENRDIKSGNIVQKFINGKNLSNIVNGFDVINDEICYIYSKADKIEIIADDIFPSCGGKMEIVVFAVYSIHVVDSSGNDTIYEDNKSGQINAIVSIDNNEFQYVKPNIVNQQGNFTDSDKVFNIFASYHYKGTKFTASKSVIQPVNTISSWMLESEPTTSIELILSTSVINNDGGMITALVKRYFSRIYCRIDSCGNKVAEKSETGHVEDIRNQCVISSPNKDCTIRDNRIYIPKQDITAPKRTIVVTAKYNEFEASSLIIQKIGGEITYTYNLSFEDGTKAKFIDLETSLEKSITVPLIAKKNICLNGKEVKSEFNNELLISSDSNWLTASLNGMVLSVFATKANKDKENDREGIITIVDNDNEIKLIVSQSSLDVVEEKIYCDFYGGKKYASEELDDANIYFKTYKVLRYEDGTLDSVEFKDDIPYDISFNASDGNYIRVIDVERIGDKYIIKFLNNTRDSANDIGVDIKLLFEDESIVSRSGYFVVKGTKHMNIPLKVIFSSKEIQEDLWTMKGGYLMVDSKTKIDLNPCWLSPEMEDTFDIAYEGSIDLPKGVHIFETFDVFLGKSSNEIKLKEKLNINEETKNILLTLTA